MASFSAELHVAGESFPVTHCAFGVAQATHQRGRVSTKVRFGPVQLTLDVPAGDALLGWAVAPQKRQPVQVLFRDGAGGSVLETLHLQAAYCVSYHERFRHGAQGGGAYQCYVTLSDPNGWTLTAGGPASVLVAPAARSHGVPGAVAAVAQAVAPFVLDAAGVPRLPRIVGNPPFTVKGPTTVRRRSGTVVTKPGLDRAEYLRQLTGQETGLNKLTVAQFLANRDAYANRKKTSKRKQPDGRDPRGDAAQKVAREEALRDKVLELRRQNRNLTQTEATNQATQWLETQTALHDPDQVAGGHADTITGMGDARVNSAIGAAWSSRIKAIDRQVRDLAKGLTPEQQQSTYLNIQLPVA